MPRLPVADLDRSIDFYAGLLGFRIGSLWPEEAPAFAILHRDDVCVQFYVADAAASEATGSGTLSFDVEDANGLHAALCGRVAIEWGPEVYWYGRREFAIRDPDSYRLIFSEETDEPPTCRDDDR
jgi:catechol 2,3-dioxygenase-like lactoylglutathione lyase family enzyme